MLFGDGPSQHLKEPALDTMTIILITLTVGLLYATWQSRRTGNEPRDVAFMAVTTASLATATAFSALG